MTRPNSREPELRRKIRSLSSKIKRRRLAILEADSDIRWLNEALRLARRELAEYRPAKTEDPQP